MTQTPEQKARAERAAVESEKIKHVRKMAKEARKKAVLKITSLYLKGEINGAQWQEAVLTAVKLIDANAMKRIGADGYVKS